MQNLHNYLFVSDLHLGAGRDRQTGLISRLEDFLHDDSFAQFLAYYARLQAKGKEKHGPDHFCAKPWKLIINGDLFEFMQIISTPKKRSELEWVSDMAPCDDLSWKERHFGLGTRERETVWKLERIFEGHTLFFQALAWFVAHQDYVLVILKGNHDVELHWPLVQEEFRKLLVKAYRMWKMTVAFGYEGKSPLHDDGNLPHELNAQDLESTVCFPPSFCYEEGLFYAEHGGQCESGTWFPNFEDPTLPEKPDLIRLPSGALFMRYVFNFAERYHPFAENLKPYWRYPLWLIQKLPKGAFRILFFRLPFGYLLKKIKKIKDWWRRIRCNERPPHVDTTQVGCSNPAMSQEFCEKLPEIQEKARKLLKKATICSILKASLSVLLKVASLIVFLVVLRRVIFLLVPSLNLEGTYLGASLLTALYLVVALFLWSLGSNLFNWADAVFKTPFLEKAAGKINKFLNSEPDGPGGVPYYLFGHNHFADIQRLEGKSGNPGLVKSQWYINTGCWLPEFDRDNPFRETYKLTYFCLMPGSPYFGMGTPRLLEWRPEAGHPRVAQLFIRLRAPAAPR